MSLDLVLEYIALLLYRRFPPFTPENDLVLGDNLSDAPMPLGPDPSLLEAGDLPSVNQSYF